MKMFYQKLSACIIAATFVFNANAQDATLLTVAGDKITKADFERVFYKNNNKENSNDEKSVREYLELYINYKLKVKEAETLKMDTAENFVTELSGYRKQLAQPYLTDKDVNDNLIKEAYDRMQKDVRASHILVKLPQDALPKDTLTAYNKGIVNAINPIAVDVTYMPVNACFVDSSAWSKTLAEVAGAVALLKGVDAPVSVTATDAAKNIAASMLSGERKAILLGNAAAHHPQASGLLALANWIGVQTGASVGYLTEAGNTVGAQWVGAQPAQSGLNAGQMLAGGLKAVVLLNHEPEFDTAAGAKAKVVLGQAQMVVSMNPFKANMDFCDVILPISPFTETSGSFVNAEGRLQSFHAVVKPLAETRPAWKVLRVLANMLDLPGFDFDASTDVLNKITGQTAALAAIPMDKLGNTTTAAIDISEVKTQPVVAAIYQIDGIVRRASSLQMTADARSTLNMPQEVNA